MPCRFDRSGLASRSTATDGVEPEPPRRGRESQPRSVPVDSLGQINLPNNSGSVNLVADLIGFYSA